MGDKSLSKEHFYEYNFWTTEDVPMRDEENFLGNDFPRDGTLRSSHNRSKSAEVRVIQF